MIDAIHSWINSVNNIVWGWPMLILLVGTHIFLIFKLKFIQKYIFKALKLAVTKDKGAPGDVSQFGALSTAVTRNPVRQALVSMSAVFLDTIVLNL